MSRYWISINISEEDANKIAGKIPTFNYTDDGFVYKTEDKEELKEKLIELKDAVKEYLATYDQIPEEQISITTQPECPECKTYHKFSALFCDNCGTALTEKEEIDISEILKD